MEPQNEIARPRTKVRRQHGRRKNIFPVIVAHSLPVSGSVNRERPDPESTRGWVVYGAVSLHVRTWIRGEGLLSNGYVKHASKHFSVASIAAFQLASCQR